MARLQVTREQADGGWLPVCACCGAPADNWRTRRWWVPPSFFYAVSLPFLAVFILGFRRCRVTLPFCFQHKRHWLVRNVIGLIGLAVAGLIWAAAFLAEYLARHHDQAKSWFANLEAWFDPVYSVVFVITMLLVLFVAAIVLSSVQDSAIQPLRITKTHVLLGRLSEDFVRQHREEIDEDLQ